MLSNFTYEKLYLFKAFIVDKRIAAVCTMHYITTTSRLSHSKEFKVCKYGEMNDPERYHCIAFYRLIIGQVIITSIQISRISNKNKLKKPVE